MNFNLSARVVAEFLGTAFLLAAVVGSGVMAERLASGNLAIALLANTLATGGTFGLLSVIWGALALGPQQSPLPWELRSLRCIGSRLRLHLPIPRLHWPAPPATPLPGFVRLTLPASWLRN
jgi:hypothetical protein